ncbi:MAG: TIGR04282 family arsenosugar biosynthesis glycosyltransferase [Verrucomicrobia bacterium]|nr:TIGR04282 family arsenosugar biosynthesis glycosyltransferase [Verrucomicrobiota bacterium]MCH8513903.1 TIGR04282 family arsenosugar biosynthesis glycosyltransferase [Kiritimatiellia bacterium]
MKPPVVLLFVKAPDPGRVKTRLAKDLGNEAAVAVYRQLVERQLQQIPKAWHTRIVYDPPEALKRFQAWLGADRDYEAQCEGDLGARLQTAVHGAFAEGTERVFCIGADCPSLNVETFETALQTLQGETDLVFAPAEDGGYVLLGLNKEIPAIFEGIPWSQPDTLKVSQAQAEQNGYRVALLPPHFDIDTRADLERAYENGWMTLYKPQGRFHPQPKARIV